MKRSHLPPQRRPINHILLHWRHTRPPRLWHIHNWTRFFKLTERYRNIPVACNGLVREMFCKLLPKSWRNPHGCRDTKWVKKMCHLSCTSPEQPTFLFQCSHNTMQTTPEWRLHTNTPSHEHWLHLCVLLTRAYVVWLKELTFAAPCTLRGFHNYCQ